MTISSHNCSLIIIRPNKDFRSRKQFFKLMQEFAIWSKDNHVVPIEVIEKSQNLRAFYTTDDAVKVNEWFSLPHNSVAEKV